MREYGHFIGGKAVAGTSGRKAPVWQPMTGEQIAEVAWRVAKCVRRSARRGGERQGGAGRMGGGQPAAPGPRADEVPRSLQHPRRRDRRSARPRTRQNRARRPRRSAARSRGDRIRLRRAAHAEGGIHLRRRPRHRPPFAAPAARRGRRHLAVQLPRHDPVVDVRPGDRRGQRLRHEAVGARSRRTPDVRRIVDGGRIAGGHLQRRQRRQGSGRRGPRRCRHQSGELRRLHPDRPIRLFARHCDRQARPVLRRCQEPHGGDARRRHGEGRRRADRRRLRLGRRALHGDLGGGAGRQGARRNGCSTS